MSKVITLGDSLSPPAFSMETSKAIYEVIRGDDFDVETYNSLLMTVLAYLENNDINPDNIHLPWAEEMNHS